MKTSRIYKTEMSVFLLYNKDIDTLLGCYSTLEEAKKAYQTALIDAQKRPKLCSIKKIKLDAPAYFFHGGHEVEATWHTGPGGEWKELPPLRFGSSD